jgi:acetyltransferase-like isoleucine patch superfamily enzyme
MYWRLNKPKWKGYLFKLCYAGSRIKVGSNFRCDTFPDVQITQNGKLTIGNDVLLRRDVEIRTHNDSQIEIGNKCRIDRGVRILAANEATIKIQEGARIGLYAILSGGDSITIGKKSLISGFVYLQTSMHRYKGYGSIQEQGFDHAPVKLEGDVWIGAHAVILPGVTLKAGSIVGSNAVVNKSVPSKTIVGGVPAKTIKERN